MPLTAARIIGVVGALALVTGVFLFMAPAIPLQVALVMLALILIAGIRARTELAVGNALTWIFVPGSCC